MADGVKCLTLRWDTGDDQLAVEDFKSRLERWFTIKDIKKESHHNYIVFQAGEKGEQLAKTWQLSYEDLKEPINVWTQLRQSVGTSENF